MNYANQQNQHQKSPALTASLQQPRANLEKNQFAKGAARVIVVGWALFVGAAMTSQEALGIYESLSETIQTKRFRAGRDDEPLTVQPDLVVPGRGKMGETLESQVLQETPPSESEPQQN